MFEEAVIYATQLHTGKKRKAANIPYILHPMEVAQIISTLTDDMEVIEAGILHDVVEDTEATLDDIRRRFGERVAMLVDSETEIKYRSEDAEKTWKRRKQESLLKLRNARDKGVRILWLADKLSNIRSIAQGVSEKGPDFWNVFHQNDPQMHKWYYTTIAEYLELDLNRTGAYKEFIKHINSLWPGTFPGEKAKYKQFRQISTDGLRVIGRGSKSTVYRYNDELILKVYNEKNMFKDIERENRLARKAFVAGIPTAISFGIVSVGNGYGSLFELIESDTVSNLIARNPDNMDYYAEAMADLARTIHNTDIADMELPDMKTEVYNWIAGGLSYADPALEEKVTFLADGIPQVRTMIHGDCHTSNVMVQNGEFLLVDMDRLSAGHPIIELSGLYMCYVAFGELNPRMVEDFLGFSCEIAQKFFHDFLKCYLKTDDEKYLSEVKDKAALLAYVRLVRRCYKNGLELSPEDRRARDYYLEKIRQLLSQVQELVF